MKKQIHFRTAIAATLRNITFVVTIFFLPFCEAFSQYTWIQKASLPATSRYYAAGFSIGNKGYIGTGLNGVSLGATTLNDFWEWDKATNVWTQKASYAGGVKYAAVGFSIGAKGYIGTGDGNAMMNFWEWDQAANSWAKRSNVGGTSGVNRLFAIGFSIGAKGYIGTGIQNGTKEQDFWEWDPNTDTWTQKANFGGTARRSAVGFSIGTKGYVGTGEDVSGVGTQDFWEWDSNTNTWAQKANFPGTARYEAVGFSIGAKGFLGTGTDKYGTAFKDFWQWDQATNTWTQEPDYGGGPTRGGVGFSIGNFGYVGTGITYYTDPNGHQKPSYPNAFWELYDSTACAVSATITSISNTTICMGDNATISASGGTTYLWSTGSVYSTIVVAPSITTTYTVIVSGTNGCSDTASITVPVKNCCTASATIFSDPDPVPNTTFCVGQNVYLSASGGTSYVWSTGETNANIVSTLSVTATYSVTTTDATGCTGTTSITFVVDPNCTTTGISQLSGNALQAGIWPNPSGGEFWLSIPSGHLSFSSSKGGENQGEVEIYNVMGEKVIRFQLLPKEGKTNSLPQGGSGWVLDLSSQPDGVYFLYIKSDSSTGEGGTTIQKLVINH